MLALDSDSEEGLFDFTKLDGSNMRTWYWSMKRAFMILDLWEAADPYAEHDEEAKLQEAKSAGEPAYPSREQYRVLCLVREMCELYIRTTLVEIRTGRAALRLLLKNYRLTDLASRSLAFEKFLALRMKEDQTILEWCATVVDHANAYVWAGGRQLEDVELVTKFRRGLCQKYRETSNLIALQDFDKPDAKVTIHSFAIRLRNCLRLLRQFDSKEAMSSISRPPFPPKNPVHKYTVCQKCAKIGHIAIDCRSQVPGMATSQQVQRSEKQATKRREKEEGKPCSSFA